MLRTFKPMPEADGFFLDDLEGLASCLIVSARRVPELRCLRYFTPYQWLDRQPCETSKPRYVVLCGALDCLQVLQQHGNCNSRVRP